MFKNCLRLISTGFTRIQTTMHGCKLTSAKLPGNSTFFRQSLVPSQQMTWENASDPGTCSNLPQVHFTPPEAKHCNPPFAINCLRLISTGFTRIQTTMHGCKLTSAKLPGNSAFFRQSLVPSRQMTSDNDSDPGTCNLPQVPIPPPEAIHCNPPFAINGFGRIGKCLLRLAIENRMNVVAINEPLRPLSFIAKSFMDDNVNSVFPGTVAVRGDCLDINGKLVRVHREGNPELIKWHESAVDYVIDTTGMFTEVNLAKKHFSGGVKKVIIGSSSNDAPMIVKGVNFEKYTNDMSVVSNASSATNCAAPLIHLINNEFGVESCQLTKFIIKNPLTARLENRGVILQRSIRDKIVHETTSAGRDVGILIPELKGKVAGDSICAIMPRKDISLLKLFIIVKERVKVEDIKYALRKNAESSKDKVITYIESPINTVGSDYIGNQFSAIVDINQVSVIGDKFVAIGAWYDNEIGYSSRLLDLYTHMVKIDKGKCLFRSPIQNNSNVVAINKPHAPAPVSFIASSFEDDKVNSVFPETVAVGGDCLDINAMFGMDIGGTLTKLVVFTPHDSPTSQTELLNYFTQYFTKNSTLEKSGHWDVHLQMDDVEICNKIGTLHFIRFPTGEIKHVLDLCEKLGMANGVSTVCATGGGAYKFEDIFKNKLNLELRQYDELDSLIRGLLFSVASNNNECYTWPAQCTENDQCSTQEYTFAYNEYPYIVVNIGSGAGVLAVHSQDYYDRLSGTCIAGGTFSGLNWFKTEYNSFDELIELAEKGDNSKIDLSVQDIYGRDYSKIGLPGGEIASSLGKMISMDKSGQVYPEDVARSILVGVTKNILSILFVCTKYEKIDTVCFVGNFLRGNNISTKILSIAMKKHGYNAIFLNHEGYFGAIGCLLSLDKRFKE